MPKGQYIFNVGETAVKRLAILNNAYGPLTHQFLKKIGLRSGMKVAEIGCGTGEITLWLAKEVGPEGEVTGIDLSSEQIAIAENRAKSAGLNNINFFAMNVLDVGKLAEKFDLVYCRFTLAFLKKPIDGLIAMRQLVAPNGLLAAEEIETSSWWGFPYSFAYNFHIEIFQKLGESRGMDFNTGPKLYNYFRDIGCKPSYVSIGVPVFRGPEQKQHMVLVVQECAQALIDANIVTASELEVLIKELERLSEDEKFLMAGARVFQIASSC
jgi:SAM-dependent methyltransferase